MSKDFHYGGQAVIEGVMMLGERNMAMAVRRPGGDLALVTKPLSKSLTGKVRKIPFVRGIVVLFQTMILGVQALFQSANISLEEEQQEISTKASIGIFGLAIAFAVGLFFMAPLGLTSMVESHLGSSAILSSFIEGIIRIIIFLAYLAAINLLPDIRRVFAYHGAEHKVVNAYEHNARMVPADVQRFSTAHVRCGTAFLFLVLVIAIVAFALVGEQALWLRFLSRIVLIPVIAAVAYEITRFAGKHADNPIMRAILLPGLALQMFTTRQPDDSQVEAAIVALQGVIEADNGVTEAPDLLLAK